MTEEQNSAPINKKLASVFNTYCVKEFSKEKIATKYEQYKTPENCNLHTRKCNSDIWKNLLSTKERQFDLQLQKAQTGTIKTANAVLSATDSLIKLKSDLTTISHKDLKTNMEAIIFKCTDVLALLAHNHSSTEQLRRECMSSCFLAEQKALAHDVHPDSKLFFGDDLPKRIAEITSTSKLLKPTVANNKFKSKNLNRFTKNLVNQSQPRYHKYKKWDSSTTKQRRWQQKPKK